MNSDAAPGLASAPYVGLRPYEERDRARFFGRGQDAERLINKIFAARLTLLYAPSAAGKTSLLKTLVLPDLREQDADVVYFDHWSVDRPLEALIGAIAPGEKAASSGRPEPVPLPDEAARERATDLVGACAQAIEASGRTLVLLLDQFEEFLLRHGDRPDPLREEIARLAHGTEDVRVVLSFREEFLGALDACFRDHILSLFGSTFHLGHLDARGTHEAIVAPAAPYGLSYSAALVDMIIADLRPRRADRRGAVGELSLPFLQIICRRLWAEAAPRLRAGATLTLEVDTYSDRLGGRAGIVQDYIGEVTSGLRPRQLDELAELFWWLAPASGLKVAFPLDILAAQTRLPPVRLQPLLELLQRNNIVRLRDAGGVSTYELFHDAFIDILRPWSAQRRELMRSRRRKHAFAVVGMLALAAVAGWGMKFYNDKQLEHAQRAERSLQLAAAARKALEQGDTREAIRRGLHAYDSEGVALDAIGLRRALSDLRRSRRLRADPAPLMSVVFAPAGDLVLSAGANGLARLWNGRNGAAVAAFSLPGQTLALERAMFLGDGTRIVAFGRKRAPAQAAGVLALWQIGREAPTWTLDLPALAELSVSHDDRWLATAARDGPLTLVAADDGRALSIAESPGGDPILSVAFSPVASLLASSDATGKVALSAIPAGAPVAAMSARDAVFGVKFSPDGSRLALAGFDTPMPPLLALPALAPAGRVAAQRADAGAKVVAFSPDGSLLAAIGLDDVVRVWSVADTSPVLELPAAKVPAVVLAFDPESQRLAVGYKDGWLRLWPLQAPFRPLFEEALHSTEIVALSFSARGDMLATLARDGEARIWGLDLIPTVQDVEGLIARGADAHRQANGLMLRVLSAAEENGLAVIGGDGKEISRLDIPPEDMQLFGFSDDGNRIIVSGRSGYKAYPCAEVWCAADEQVVSAARRVFTAQ